MFLNRAVQILWRAAIVAVAIVITCVVAGLIFGLWANLTLWVWGHYGDNAFMYWLIVNALVILLILVAVW